MELLKLLSTSQIVAQIISFFILLIILRVFLWKRFLKVLDDRRTRIADTLRDIETAKLEAEKNKADYAAVVGKIDEMAKIKIQEASSEGRRLAEEIVENARVEADKMVDNAKESIRQEMVKAKGELKEEIVDLAIKVSEKLIQAELTEKQDKRLVEEFLNEIEGVK